MATFVIEVAWNGPFPRSEEFRIEATSLPTAVGRGLRQWKKAHKGKRIKNLTIEVTKL